MQLSIELSKSINALQEAINKRVDAFEKSVTDRITNISKQMEQVEKFYRQPFYKAIKDEANPEGVVKSLAEKAMKGELQRR